MFSIVCFSIFYTIPLLFFLLLLIQHVTIKMEIRELLELNVDKLGRIEQRLDGIDQRLDRIDDRLNHLEQRMNTMELQMKENTQLIHAIIHRQEETEAKIDSMAMDLPKTQGEITSMKEQTSVHENVENLKMDGKLLKKVMC